MKKHLKYILGAIVSTVIALSFSGCGGDSSSSPTGPAAGSSFAGTSITFNPTINFLTGTTLTYLNTTPGSAFPSALVAANGTFTYVPNASYTGGTLTLTVDGIMDPIVLEIGNFVRSGANITGFTAKAGGQSYPVTVTGTLPAYQSHSGGGGGGGLGAGETAATDIPSSVRGTHALVFFKSTETTTGLPADGTQTSFVIGAGTLAFNSKTLSNPVFYNGNTQEWLFKDGSLTYALSLTGLGGLNEINIYGPVGGNNFYGQYRAAAATTLSADKIASGSVNVVMDSSTLGIGFPSDSVITAGTTGTFTFGSDTVSYDSVTYNFVRIDHTDGSSYSAHVYSATVAGHTDTVTVGVSVAGSSSFITYVTLERVRDAVSPATGTPAGTFFFGIQ